jgi:hypothetical protein
VLGWKWSYVQRRKFGAASSEEMTAAILPPISHHPTRHFSTNDRLIRSGFFKWSRPLLIDSTSPTEFDVTHSKQSIRKFLTGARTHISVSRFCANKWSRSLLTETSSQTEFDVTHSIQTCGEFLTETRIDPLPTSLRAFFAERFRPQNRISNRLALSDFSEGYGLGNCISNRFCNKNRSCRKETIKPSLTGSRFASKVLQSRDEFRAAPYAQRKKESASRDASEQGKISPNAQNEKEPQ